MAKQEPETYRDRAGRLRRRRQASPDERRARDAEACRLYGCGWSMDRIAQELGWGKGTIERAIKNAPPPCRMIRGERVEGRPRVTIDGRLFKNHDAPELVRLSPTGIAWGHYGAGPKRLAAMILSAVTDSREARRYAPSFAVGCLLSIPAKSKPWTLTTDAVRSWLVKSREVKDLKPEEALPLEVKPAAWYRPQR